MTAQRYHSAPHPSMDASGMELPADAPLGLIAVPVPKAVLLLTEAEYVGGSRRGKWPKRTQGEARRDTTSAAGPVVGSDEPA
jgi:hypothetical protein